MKKAIITLALVLSAGIMMAQGLHFGPRAGFTVSNFIEKSSFGTTDTYSKPGFQLGATAELEVLSFLYVGTTLSLYQKGYKNPIIEGVIVSKNTFTFLDLPIEIGYKMPIGNVSVYGQIGPYASVALAGKSRVVNHDEPDMNEDPYSLYEYETYKRFDTGISIAVGADYKQYQVRINYTRGLTDFDEYDSYTTKTSSFGFSAAYFFGRNY